MPVRSPTRVTDKALSLINNCYQCPPEFRYISSARNGFYLGQILYRIQDLRIRYRDRNYGSFIDNARGSRKRHSHLYGNSVALSAAKLTVSELAKAAQPWPLISLTHRYQI